MARSTDSILRPEVRPIDLATALRLAGVRNPELLIARRRVVEAVALRQLAAAQILPTINGGMNYHLHSGNLQQSNGNILSLNRSSLYLGAGSDAVGSGTVEIPGVLLAGNVAESLYLYLGARQEVRQREFTSEAERNRVLLEVSLAYCELCRAEGRLAVARQVEAAARELGRITAEYARTGEGRPADADRAATYLSRRRAAVREAEGDVLTASARLCRLLNLDPSIRLHPTDAWVVPQPLVPEPIPLPELIALALLRRPELRAQRAAIEQALLALEGARVLPFSPTVLIGYSGGTFGGGSDLVVPTFGAFSSRSDFDVLAFWTLQSLGVGNVALIRVARANVDINRYQGLQVLDRIRSEVAEAYARVHARFAQIGEAEAAVRSGSRGFGLDLERIRQAVPEGGGDVGPARPIEVLDSLRLMADAMDGYLDAIVDYNRAHFELYVALGQPPAAALARPIPTAGVGADGAIPAAPGPDVTAGEAAQLLGDGAPPPPPAPAASPFAAPDRPTPGGVPGAVASPRR